MQATSDIFLGWTTGPEGHHFYWRQLRDMKYSPDLSLMAPEGMEIYAGVCGHALARAHARAGNRAAIGAYLGSGTQFSEAVADFAMAYADLAESDYEELQKARADGRLPS
jgi:predicted alpha/beta hydrolase